MLVDLMNDKVSFEVESNGNVLKVFGAIFSNSLTSINDSVIKNFIRSPEDYISGDFCFIIEGSVYGIYLGSSRSGTHPIYFRIHEGALIISDSLGDVIRAAIHNSLSIDAAYQFLTYEFVADPMTLVDGVYKVPSACVVQFDEYLDHEFHKCTPCISSVKEDPASVHEFVSKIYSAHERRTSCSNRNALLLSGGIDSCVTAVVLKELVGAENIIAFNFSTLGAEQDEYLEAKRTADYLGVECEHVMVDPNKEVDLSEIVLNTNVFYPGAIMISEVAKHSGPSTNFISCQDTRLHTPSMNPLDKFIFSIGARNRRRVGAIARAIPNPFPATSKWYKVIDRAARADDLAAYIGALFFHRHETGLIKPNSSSLDVECQLRDIFETFEGEGREIYNNIVQLAWDRQYTDDIQYMRTTTSMYGSTCQMPWYDRDLSITSASLPMSQATKYIKGRAGHSEKSKRVNKYLLRRAFSGKLPDEIMFRDKAVCVTNHLYISGCYRPYIEEMKKCATLFHTEAGRALGLEKFFQRHASVYMTYTARDYVKVVELQTLVALELYCSVFDLR